MAETKVSGEFARIRIVAELVPPLVDAGGGAVAVTPGAPLPPRPGSAGAAGTSPASVDVVESSMVEAVHLQNRGEIQAAVRNEIRRELGPDVQVDDFLVTKGSIELLFVLTTTLTVIKNVNEYVEALAKASENVRRVVHAVLARMPAAQMQLRSWSDFEVGAGVTRARRSQLDDAGGRAVVPAPSANALIVYVLALNSLLVVTLLLVVLFRDR
jgi:hypothetical protein